MQKFKIEVKVVEASMVQKILSYHNLFLQEKIVTVKMIHCVLKNVG